MIFILDTPDSDAIIRVEYDDVIDELSVTMRKGSSRLVYGQVPKSVFLQFEKVGSVGAFFNREIRRSGRYPFLGEIS